MPTLPLRAALERGLLLVSANWQVVLIDFAIESLYQLSLSIPVLGAALMVGALVGTDLGAAVADGVGPTADLVLGSLASAPVALIAFLSALALVGIGGEVVMSIVKGGTLAIIVTADRRAGEVQADVVSSDTFHRAAHFHLEPLIDRAREFAPRTVRLALILGAVYVVLGAGYVAIVTYGVSLAPDSRLAPAWPVLVLLATSAGIVSATAANLAYDLLRVIVITDDCSVRMAWQRLCRFMIEDARQVIGIFSVIGGVQLLAGAASLLATAGLTPIAYLPFMSLIIVPLQVALWLFRGLLFQAMALAALAAYQTQYRRFSETRWEPLAPTADRATEIGARPEKP